MALAIGIFAVDASAEVRSGVAEQNAALFGGDAVALNTSLDVADPIGEPPLGAVPKPATTFGDTHGYSRRALDALPVAEGGEEWYCLTEALYFEARGESALGLFAVSEVILNRVDSARYPDTVCGVINQGTGQRWACQFTYTCDGLAETISEPRAWDRVGKVARMMLDGEPRVLTDGATHYHSKAVNPHWASAFPLTASIGSHLFYRQPTQTARN